MLMDVKLAFSPRSPLERDDGPADSAGSSGDLLTRNAVPDHPRKSLGSMCSAAKPLQFTVLRGSVGEALNLFSMGGADVCFRRTAGATLNGRNGRIVLKNSLAAFEWPRSAESSKLALRDFKDLAEQ